VPPAIEKVFKFVPTPAPEPTPPPVKPRTSALAVFAVLTSTLAFLTALGASVCILAESAMKLGAWDLDAVRVGAFVSAAVAVFIAIPGFLMGTTASALVREARGALRGKGAGQAAAFLAMIAVAMPLLHVKPHLADVERRMGEARAAADRVVEDLRAGRFAEARAGFSAPLQERLSEVDLKTRVEKGLQKHAQRWQMLRSFRAHVAGSTARVDFHPFGSYDGVTLEYDTQWRVTELHPLLKRLGD